MGTQKVREQKLVTGSVQLVAPTKWVDSFEQLRGKVAVGPSNSREIRERRTVMP